MSFNYVHLSSSIVICQINHFYTTYEAVTVLDYNIRSRTHKLRCVNDLSISSLLHGQGVCLDDIDHFITTYLYVINSRDNH